MRKFLPAAVGFALLTFFSAARGEEKPRPTGPVVTGLDGANYLGYRPGLVRKAQEALKSKDLYAGEINGELDEATMKAMGEFQKQNSLPATGVPTPKTRAKLFAAESDDKD